jgi:hypothetical protein
MVILILSMNYVFLWETKRKMLPLQCSSLLIKIMEAFSLGVELTAFTRCLYVVNVGNGITRDTVCAHTLF